VARDNPQMTQIGADEQEICGNLRHLRIRHKRIGSGLKKQQ
jgi:hypothetical protein